MKKILFAIALTTALIGCSKDNDELLVTAPNLSHALGEDNTKFGTYKGVFTTLDSEYRAIVDINIPSANSSSVLELLPSAKIKLHSGEVFIAYANHKVEEGMDITALSFYSNELSFDFTVGATGSDVVISNAFFMDKESDIIVIKDTERAPVTPITGTWDCTVCNGHPKIGQGQAQTFNFIFSSPDGTGSITTQSTLGSFSTGGIGVQDNCVAMGTETTCDIESGDGATTTTGMTINGNPLTWTGTHTFNNEPTANGNDCSGITGTWTWESLNYGVLSGYFVSDALCVNALIDEDFEDAVAPSYTPSVPDDLTDIANGDYFGIISPTSGLPADVIYSNAEGNFYGVQDTDSANSGNVERIELNWTNIDVSDTSDLDFSILVAEDDAADGGEDWDTTSSLRIEVQFDGGGFNPILAFESEIGVDGNATNELPRQDTNFDTNGDGMALTNIFTSYMATISTGGATNMDVRIVIRDLDTGEEDVAFDNFVVVPN